MDCLHFQFINNQLGYHFPYEPLWTINQPANPTQTHYIIICCSLLAIRIIIIIPHWFSPVNHPDLHRIPSFECRAIHCHAAAAASARTAAPSAARIRWKKRRQARLPWPGRCRPRRSPGEGHQQSWWWFSRDMTCWMGSRWWLTRFLGILVCRGHHHCQVGIRGNQMMIPEPRCC